MTHRDVENAITNFDIERSISVIRRADADRYTINKIATVENDLSIHRRELRLLVAEGAIYKVSIGTKVLVSLGLLIMPTVTYDTRGELLTRRLFVQNDTCKTFSG